MRIPKNISGSEFALKLKKLGYEFVRQRGSHYLVRTSIGGKQTLSIPMHKPIKAGTLHKLLRDTASHHEMTIEELLSFLKL